MQIINFTFFEHFFNKVAIIRAKMSSHQISTLFLVDLTKSFLLIQSYLVTVNAHTKIVTMVIMLSDKGIPVYNNPSILYYLYYFVVQMYVHVAGSYILPIYSSLAGLSKPKTPWIIRQYSLTTMIIIITK